ncbi:MAG: Mrp/NBP35 family ATP-binding protein [Alphaproteobacteria bacterium]|nr:Mrp/NBP35 family ATP-binding protein [Alphaproteobacteria bacterium]
MTDTISKQNSQADESIILAALKGLKHPQTGRDILSMDMVQGLTIKGGKVSFALAVLEDEAEACEPLRQACQTRILALAGVDSATIVLTAHKPAPDIGTQGAHRTSASRTAPKPPQKQTPAVFEQIDAVIAVASGKGGVGKSTIAVNLAAALAADTQNSKTIGLLDADIYGPSTPQLLAVSEKPQVGADKKLIPIVKHKLQTMSIGYMVAPEQAMIWRGPMVQGALLQMLNDVAWPPLNILVIDLPPGTGDIQLTLAQQIPVRGALIVTTPQSLALADVRRCIAMFQKTKTPILGMVENMAWMTAPDGSKLYPFGESGGQTLAQSMNIPYLTSLPLDAALQSATQNGTPIIAHAPQSNSAIAFRELAKLIQQALT